MGTLRGMDVLGFRSIGLGVMLLCGSIAAAAGGDSTPVVVTTDTPEYCQKLSRRISKEIQAASEPMPVEVASLSTEGQRMCDSGLTRGGILRLRRALLLLEQGQAAP